MLLRLKIVRTTNVRKEVSNYYQIFNKKKIRKHVFVSEDIKQRTKTVFTSFTSLLHNLTRIEIICGCFDRLYPNYYHK